jgi:integrase
MARVGNKLTAKFVQSLKPDGSGTKHQDGGGLYLHQMKTANYWRCRYTINNSDKIYTIGAYPTVTLAEARTARDEVKKMVARDLDPNVSKRILKETDSTDTVESVSLEWYLQKHKFEVSEDHAKKNYRKLEKDVFPHIGKMPIRNVTPQILLGVLRKIEERGVIETANRTKTVFGKMIRYAIVTGRAERDITVDLRDALKTPNRKHYASLTKPEDVAEYLKTVEVYKGSHIVRIAMKMLPYLAQRPGEFRNMKWSDINFESKQWIYVPYKRKSGETHIVPLSEQVIAMLKEIKPYCGESIYVFPSERGWSRAISDNTINKAYCSLDYSSDRLVAHGWRSTFRTIGAEVLEFPVEWLEMQLAHSVKDPLGRAYNRTQYIKQRTEMMQKWADYLDELRNI